MKKTVTLTESDLVKIINKLLTKKVINEETYLVQKGDTLTTIAKKFGVSADDIARDNNIPNIDNIKYGTTLTINNKPQSGSNLNRDKPTKGQNYYECFKGVYTRGCYHKNVKTVQSCLKLNPTGFFGPKTQQKLKDTFPNKNYYVEFVDSDIYKICVKNNPSLSKSKNVLISNKISPEYLKQIDFSKINPQDSTYRIIPKPGTSECAQFVNWFSENMGFVGNAWNAYENDSHVGKTIFSKFSNLTPEQIKTATEIWQKIHKRGGPKEEGPTQQEIINFLNKLVPYESNVDLELDDVVGIYNPSSDHHEEAFYEGGKNWFNNINGKMVPNERLKSGKGWGMNTHVGIVGAIKNGVPLIFHNKKGNVISDPPSKLRIAWVKRKGGITPIKPQDYANA